MPTITLEWCLTHVACLVIGGGPIALRKVERLLSADANLTILSPVLCEALEALVDSRKLQWIEGSWPSSDVQLSAYKLVIAATQQVNINDDITAQCKKQHILCHHVGAAHKGDIRFPALVDTGGISWSLYTGGRSPAFLKQLKGQLEGYFYQDQNTLLEYLAKWRPRVKQHLSIDDEQRFWPHLFNSQIPALVHQGEFTAAEQQFERYLTAASSQRLLGRVTLIGAGPGDPELLTLKAVRDLKNADVVLYDRLVSNEILALIPQSAQRIYVGKRRAEHAVPQDEINQQLLALAHQGHQVVRLKGGDPFIFGRGGEEIEDLLKEGIEVMVIPGITAASGCATYAGIPLTHRDYSQSVQLVAGHLKSPEFEPRWASLVAEQQTLVFYMGTASLPTICAQLLQHGMTPSMPVAIIDRGTTVNQRVIYAQINNINAVLSQAIANEGELVGPTLIVIGRVVAFAANLRH